MRVNPAIAIALAAIAASPALAQVRITEFMYQGANGEFVELTNTSASPVNMTGWSFDDDSRTPGSETLSAFGTLAPGESVIFTENTAAAFSAAWALPASVKVIGGILNNLGRNDEINIYDAGSALIDRLAFGDQNIPGSIRANNVSGWTTPANLGANSIATWVLSTVGDAQGSYRSSGNDLGNPGTYSVPAPGSLALLGVAGLVSARRRRAA